MMLDEGRCYFRVRVKLIARLLLGRDSDASELELVEEFLTDGLSYQSDRLDDEGV